MYCRNLLKANVLYQCPLCGCIRFGQLWQQPLPAAPHLQTATQRNTSSTSSSNPEEVHVDSPGRRKSPLGIQMLSKSLHEHIFRQEPEISSRVIKRSQKHLRVHGLGQIPGSVLPDVDIQLPPLLGKDIDEHFRTIARAQSEPSLSLAQRLASCVLPPMPRRWKFEPGWTRYDGKEAMKVDYPDDDVLILDVEVCVPESQRPILATAVSDKYWYSWVSKRLTSSVDDFYADMQRKTVLDDMIPLETREGELEPVSGSWQQRLVVGHNVSYDRAMIKEQYLIKGPGTKFLDTLSLHTCVAGQTTTQKILWKNRGGWDAVRTLATEPGRRQNWMSVSSPNSLQEVHWLYVGSKTGEDDRGINKQKRDVFTKGTIKAIRKQFQGLVRYCAEDVYHTHEVLQKVLPLFLQRFPHPVSFAGMLEMGLPYLPVDTSWERYLAAAEYTFQDMEGEMKAKLMALADRACKYIHDQRYESSPWLCNLDWSSKPFRGKAKKKREMKKLLADIEEHYRREKEAFWAGGRRTEGGAGMEESEGKKGKESEGKKGKESEGKKGKESEGKKGKESEGKKGKESKGKKGKESEGKKGKESKGKKGKESEGKKGKESEGKEGEEGDGKEGEGRMEEENDEKFTFLISSEELLLKKRPVHMPGYPEWYRSMCMRRYDDNWRPGCTNISAQMKVAPYLLRMKWKGHPLYHHRHLGWGYIMSPELQPGEIPQWEAEDEGRGMAFSMDSDLETDSIDEMVEEYWIEGDDPQGILLESLGGDFEDESEKLAKKQGVAAPSVELESLKDEASIATEDKPASAEKMAEGEEVSIMAPEVQKLAENEAALISSLHAMTAISDCQNSGLSPKTPTFEISNRALVKPVTEETKAGSRVTMKLKTKGRKKGEEEREESFEVCRVETEFGRTDDIVTLGNGKEYYFFKLPHKDGGDSNVGNPLSKSYLHKMESRTLTSAAGPLGQRILTLNSMVSFWRGARKRILDQFVIWLNGTSENSSDRSEIGAIIPNVKVAGTATRRAVEATWLTASNAKESRVGSELKAMVRAPPGYHVVGADVDSQELWIASVLGDMHFAGVHGSTAIGWMTLQGSKAEGTDLHSKTASTIGISRDHAKILNYGRIYGAGRPFIEVLLKQFNPNLSAEEVTEKAGTLYAATKGVRKYRLTEAGRRLAKAHRIPFDMEGFIDRGDLKMLTNVNGQEMELVYGGRHWAGGSESHLFNKLESIALSPHPRTPVLGCYMSRALEHTSPESFVPSKVNWVVQSSAVDYLHLMLVSMQWLFDMYGIDGRFCISIHDEVRFLVKSEDRYRATLALQFTNLLTRSMFSHHLKMNDLPQSVAFFSAVDIDTVLRKEANMDCKTPSNPLGLEQGHGIPHGEVLDIYQVIEKTNGSLRRD